MKEGVLRPKLDPSIVSQEMDLQPGLLSLTDHLDLQAALCTTLHPHLSLDPIVVTVILVDLATVVAIPAGSHILGTIDMDLALVVAISVGSVTAGVELAVPRMVIGPSLLHHILFNLFLEGH